MGRYQTTFPYTFNNAPGDLPASRLDDDFDAVNLGVLTLRAQELSDGNDYNVEQDDEYSYFVCKGVDDFQIIPPVAPARQASASFSPTKRGKRQSRSALLFVAPWRLERLFIPTPF